MTSISRKPTSTASVGGRAGVDTSALLALANPRDQYHASAVAIARRFVAAGGRWLGTPLILGELHALLLRRLGIPAARAIIRAILADPAYEWADVGTEVVGEAVVRWLERFADQRFSLVDAVSFEVMRRERLRVAFAFDRDFQTAGYELLT